MNSFRISELNLFKDHGYYFWLLPGRLAWGRLNNNWFVPLSYNKSHHPSCEGENEKHEKQIRASPDFNVCKDCLGLQMAAGEEKRDLTGRYCPDQEAALMAINLTIFIAGVGCRDNY